MIEGYRPIQHQEEEEEEEEEKEEGGYVEYKQKLEMF